MDNIYQMIMIMTMIMIMLLIMIMIMINSGKCDDGTRPTCADGSLPKRVKGEKPCAEGRPKTCSDGSSPTGGNRKCPKKERVCCDGTDLTTQGRRPRCDDRKKPVCSEDDC